MKVATFISLLSLVFAYLAPFISPASSAIFAIFGLVMPIIIAVNIVISLYWLLRMDRLAVVSISLLIISLLYLPRIMQIPTVKQKRPNGAILKLVTFNTHVFADYRNYAPVFDETIEYLSSINPGIICFQEYYIAEKNLSSTEFNKFSKKYPYKFSYNIKKGEKNRDYRMAIYSKYKIVNQGAIELNSSTHNGSMYVDIVYLKDTIRVINNHLQTSSIKRKDIRFLMGQDVEAIKDDDVKQGLFRVFSILTKLTNNYKIRAEQADKINEFVETTKYPIIVCGDHNDTPISYAYNRVKGDLKDAFVEQGKWYGYTFKHFAKLLRIDYVFHSDHFSTVSYQSPDTLHSDHKPIIVEMKYNK